MNAWGEVILSYALNSCWQLPVIAFAAWIAARALSGGTARLRHALWLMAAVLGSVLPACGIWGLFAPSTTYRAAEPAALTLFAERLFLTLFAVCALWRGLRLLAASAAAHRWRKKAAPFPSAGIAVLAPRVQVLLSPPELEKAGPLLTGIFHPAILLPKFLAAPENRNLLNAAIAHELAHLRRNDMLAYFLSEFVLLPLAFHPVTWWLRRKLSETRELACDECVARESLTPAAYARCLVEMARHIVSAAPVQSLGIAEGGVLERRIRALLEMPRRIATRLNPWQRAACILALGIFCVFLAKGAGTLYLWIARPTLPPRSILVPPPPPPPPPPPSRKVL